MAVVGVEEDPDRVVGRVELEKDSAESSEGSAPARRIPARQSTHSIVFSTSSNPRLVSLSLFPSVARKSPMIFSTCPHTLS